MRLCFGAAVGILGAVRTLALPLVVVLGGCASAPPCPNVTASTAAATSAPSAAPPAPPKPLLSGAYEVLNFEVDGKTLGFAEGFFGDDVKVCPAGDLRLEFDGSRVTARGRFVCYDGGKVGKTLKLSQCSIAVSAHVDWSDGAFTFADAPEVESVSTTVVDTDHGNGNSERKNDGKSCSFSLPKVPLVLKKVDADANNVALQVDKAVWNLGKNAGPPSETAVVDEAVKILRARP